MDSGILPGSPVGLTDLSPTDRPWDVHRLAATVIAENYAASFPNHRTRINECSKRLGFKFNLEMESGEVRLRLFAARFCRVRHCPVCQWRRSLMWRARFFEAMPRVIEAHPTARFVFLTLTIRNCPLGELRDTVGTLNKAWGRMVKLKRFPALGWVKAVEVTRNADTREAHPHLHVLMLVGSGYFGKNYIKQADWQLMWQKCLRVDYEPIVNIKAVKSKDGDTEGFVRGVLETLKYQTKPEDLVHAGPYWLAELTRQLHKTRAVAVGGCLKEYLSEEEPEDLIGDSESEDNGSASDVYFGWRERVSRYIKEDEGLT